MANNSVNKNTGTSPVGYAGPTRNADHPGVYYGNTGPVVLSDSASVLIRGPEQYNGTRFIDGILFKNEEAAGEGVDPINVTLRLVTIPLDQYTNDNEYNEAYIGLPADDIDCIGVCAAGTYCWRKFNPLYLKGNQALVAYASSPDLVKATIMWREEL